MKNKKARQIINRGYLPSYVTRQLYYSMVFIDFDIL